MKLHIKELQHVALQVADVALSIDFYENRLGLERLDRPAFDFPGAWFRLGPGQELHLIGGREAPAHSHKRGNHFALRVDDLKAAENLLKTQQIDYLPPKARPDGVMQLFFTDPDGYWIELFDGKKEG